LVRFEVAVGLVKSTRSLLLFQACYRDLSLNLRSLHLHWSRIRPQKAFMMSGSNWTTAVVLFRIIKKDSWPVVNFVARGLI